MEKGHPGIDDYESFEREALKNSHPCRGEDSCKFNSPRVLGEVIERRTPRRTGAATESLRQAHSIVPVEDRMMKEIDEENRKRIATMTSESIQAEVESLKASLPASIIEKWTKRKH